MSLWFKKSKKLSSELTEALEKYIAENYVEETVSECVCSNIVSDFGGAESFISEDKIKSPEPLKVCGKAAPTRLRSNRKAGKNALESVEFTDEEPNPPRSFASQAFMGAAPAAMAMATPTGKTLEDALKKLDKNFMELVFYFADEKGLTDAELQKKANIDRKAFSKLRCGTTKNPSKSTALALALALELTLDDTKDLLSRAGFALSPCSRQDLIVQFFIERKVFDIDAVNTALYEHGESLLGCSS